MFSARNKNGGSAQSLRGTPSNSPSVRPPTRSGNKPSLYQSALSLQTVIGTTTTTPNGFSYHDQSKSFALCAGSAGVLAELDDDDNVVQRFFRARPTASSINPVTSFYNPSTPPATPDARSKTPNIKAAPYNGGYSGSPSTELSEAFSPRAWSSRERVKAVTSVAISPNGRFLVLGETGYNPRVLIFSTAKDAAPDIPLSILTEHSYGVRALAWSSNSQYLATLGQVNDGFLFVWSMGLRNGSAKLHFTNKCTNVVRDMTWLGHNLITVGVRHVRVWRLPDSRPVSPSKSRTVSGEAPIGVAPRALSGRNPVLGHLAVNTFTSVVAISDSEAVVGSDSGALCLLDDDNGSPQLTLVKHLEFGVTSLTVDSDRECIWIGGRCRQMRRLAFDSLRPLSNLPSPRTLSRSPVDATSKEPAITCIGSLASHLITVDGTKAIHIYPVDKLNDQGEQCDGGTTMPAHRDSVLGIGPLMSPNHLSADFFTWSRRGVVKFWDTEGECRDSRTIPVEHFRGDDGNPNELKILRANKGMDTFVSGDKLGILRVFQGQPWKCVNEVRAHGGEITDIALHEAFDSCLIATSGRDRMVQLFERRDDSLQLIQTMDDHVGAVGQLLFVNGGERLLSSSADRTVLIRDRATREADGVTAVAYLVSKVITLKSSPVSMSLSPDDPDSIIFSTVDRCVQQYDLSSGRHIHSFRAADSDSNDTVVMGSLTVTSAISGQNPKLLIGVSGTDKCIRVYDLEKGAFLTGEFGHTEGVSDVRVLEKYSHPTSQSPERVLISSGIDGVVMIWNISVQLQQPQAYTQPAQTSSADEEETTPKEPTLSKPPLRKVLSRQDLAGFQRPEGLALTPTPVRDLPQQSPPMLRRLSKVSIAPPARNTKMPTTPTSAPPRRSPTSAKRPERLRNSPSPPSPKSTGAKKNFESRNRSNGRCSSLDFRARSRGSGKSDFGSLNMSTEQVCRTLRAYRKKLNGSSEPLHSQKELERELNLTLRSLNHRSKRVDTKTRGETETDSSGKENERIPPPPPIPSKNGRAPRRIPSTPNLGQKESPKHSSRRRSVGGA